MLGPKVHLPSVAANSKSDDLPACRLRKSKSDLGICNKDGILPLRFRVRAWSDSRKSGRVDIGVAIIFGSNKIYISIVCKRCAATARAAGLPPLAAATRRGRSAGGLCRACAIKLFQLLSKQLIFEDGKAAPPPGPRRSQP